MTEEQRQIASLQRQVKYLDEVIAELKKRVKALEDSQPKFRTI